MSESEVMFEFLGQSVTLPPPQERVIDVSALEVSDVIVPTREFVASIRRFGVIAPVVLFDDGERLRVADGRRRIAAARAIGLEQVPVTVYETNSFMPDLVSMVLNEQRRDNPVADFNAIQRLQQRGATEREIAEVTGMPLGRIRRRMNLAALHPNLFEALGRGALSVAVAESSAALPLAFQMSLLDRLSEKDKLTMSDIQAVRTVRKAQAVNTLALDGIGNLLSTTTMPASLTEVIAVLSTHTLQRILTELPAEPCFDAVRQAVMHELAEGWRAPLSADAFTRASTVTPAH